MEVFCGMDWKILIVSFYEEQEFSCSVIIIVVTMLWGSMYDQASFIKVNTMLTNYSVFHKKPQFVSFFIIHWNYGQFTRNFYQM